MKDGRSFLPLICYEAIFPDELGYEGAGASAIINVTNDAWYGDTPGPYQHFRQAQVRAVEQGLPLIRAANNGLSAIVDTYGRITGSLALDAVGVVDSYLPSPRDPFWGRPPGWIQNGFNPVNPTRGKRGTDIIFAQAFFIDTAILLRCYASMVAVPRAKSS